jgi:hypothetical protein
MAAGVLIEVGNADLENVRYVRNRSFRISGRIVIEGREGDLDVNSLRLGLVNLGEGGAEASLKPDGTFTISANLEDGDYRLAIAPILRPPSAAVLQQSTAIDGPSASLQNAYVKSIRSGEGDILNEPFRLRNVSDNPVMIVINLNGGVLEGRVVTGRQEPADRAFVSLIPASQVPVSIRPDRYKSASTDASTFSHAKAVLGTRRNPYELKLTVSITRRHLKEVCSEGAMLGRDEHDGCCAAGDMYGAWQDPLFLSRLEGLGRAVRIDDGAGLTLEITTVGK